MKGRPGFAVIRYRKRFWVLAVLLAALAGFVDAIGFLKLGGLFVSFMSGNSTRMAVGLAERSEVAAAAAGLIGSFVVGVVAGSLLAAAARTARKPAVLVLVGLLLAGAGALDRAGAGLGTALLMAAAMGAANCVFQRDGEVSIGVTYMTGTLVKFGQRVAAAVLGGDPLGWLPYLILWLGLVCGAVTGAGAYLRLGPNSLWIASGAAILLALLAHRLGPAEPVRTSSTFPRG